MNSGGTLATVRSYDWLREGLEEKPVPKEADQENNALCMQRC